MDFRGWSEFSQIQDKFNRLFKDKWQCSSSTLKTRNIIAYDRDLLFIWNAKDKNILVVNFTLFVGINGAKYHQTLELNSIPDWSVDRLLVNETGTHLLLCGARGACLVILPAKWGTSGLFVNARQSVLCQSSLVHTNLFNSTPTLQIREARWCPAPLPEQLFVILTSDNVLRLYRASKVSSPLQQWQIGRPLGRGSLMNPGSSLPLLAALGDTAVSFDFLPGMPSSALDIMAREPTVPETSFLTTKPSGTSTPMPQQLNRLRMKKGTLSGDLGKTDITNVVWPIAVLFGHGDVYIVVPPNLHPSKRCAMRAKLYGPLRMFPATEDNYGAESCSLMCLQTQPPVLVIASSSGGALYHALLLERHEEIEAADEASVSSCFADCDLELNECSKSLYVVEKVILELGMSLQENQQAEEFVYSCPISLIRDTASSSRYFCSHDGGVHVVSMPLVASLLNVAFGKSNVGDVVISKSQVCYLLCTRLNSQDNSTQHICQGVMLQPTMNIGLALLSSGQAALLSIPVSASLPVLLSDESDTSSKSRTEEKCDFAQHVMSLLTRNKSQPCIMLPPGAKLSNRECLDMLVKSTQTLRSEYIAKHAIVTEAFKTKVAVQRKMLQNYKANFASLKMDTSELSVKMVHLRKLLEEKKSKMQNFSTRLQKLHVKLSLAEPSTSEAESQMKSTLVQLQPKVIKYHQSMYELLDTFNALKSKKENEEDYETEKGNLSEQQEALLTAELKEIQERKQKIEGNLLRIQSACKEYLSNRSPTKTTT